MTFLATLLANRLNTLPASCHEDFKLALAHSFSVDPITYTPDTFEPFGFEQRELYDLRVLALRVAA